MFWSDPKNLWTLILWENEKEVTTNNEICKNKIPSFEDKGYEKGDAKKFTVNTPYFAGFDKFKYNRIHFYEHK